MKISAIVLTYNSEELIKDCLESLDWVDETIIVDDGSTDGTLKKVKEYKNTRVFIKEGDFFENRNFGAKKANGDWIFYVDADERVTPLLRKEIKTQIVNPKLQVSAYAIPRRNFIFNKEFKYSGQRPDYVKRLFKKEKFEKWTGELHEEPHFEGELGYLKNQLVHKKHDNLSDMVEKTNKWSEIEAKLMFEAKHPPMNIFRFMSAMFREFWLRMIKQTAFLDGVEGIIYAAYQVFSRTVSYTKLWEMQNSKS